MTLSRPQLYRLRCVKRRQLFAADINRGNERRTYASLFKLGLIDWDPLHTGRLKLTALGENVLVAGGKLDPPGTLRICNVGDFRVITLTGEHKP